jgi:hypothetical protein
LGDVDCANGFYCEAMKCVTKKDKGGTCTKDAACKNNNTCVDGRCCTSLCNGVCEACNVMGMEGDCKPIPNNTDPSNECVGHCNGLGACAPETYTTNVQPVFVKYCSPCHNGGGSGGTNFAMSYAQSQLMAGTCAGKTVGACTVVRIKTGSMPQGEGCTGNPVMDAGNLKCLTANELQIIEDWISAGQLP